MAGGLDGLIEYTLRHVNGLGRILEHQVSRVFDPLDRTQQVTEKG